MGTRRTVAAHTPTPQASRSLVQALPSEILLIIFRYAYVTANYLIYPSKPCQEPECWEEEKCFCYLGPRYDRTWEDDGCPPPALFPNSVASVCSRWGKLMLLNPLFWSRIIILLDNAVFPPPDLKHQLRLSVIKKEPLHIIVSRTSFSDAVGLKEVEKSRMVYIIKALRRHLKRCQVLRIDVVHSSSLPRVLAVLPPVMEDLSELSLTSCIDSGPPEVQPYSLSNQKALVEWRELATVTIDGWNLAEIHSRTPASGDPILSGYYTLSVKFGAEGFPLRIFNDGYISSLEIDSVAFARGDPSRVIYPYAVTLRNLTLEDTNLALLQCDATDVLTIDNCPLPSIKPCTAGNTLILKNISSSRDIQEFLILWHGRTLRVIGCAGFDDDVLKTLCVYNTEETRLPRLNVYRLAYLYIQDCQNFSVEGAAKFVKERNGSFQGLETIKTMCVSGYGSALSEEDFRWFNKKLHLEWGI